MPDVHEGMIALKDIIIDQTYLARVKPRTTAIAEYVEALMNGSDLTKKDPIVLEEGTNKLLGGYHRVKAYEQYLGLLNGRNGDTVGETLDLWPPLSPEVPCEFHTCPSGKVPSLYAFELNNEHGLRPLDEDAKKVCQDQYKTYPGTSIKMLMQSTKRSYRTVRKYLGDLLNEFEHTRDAAMQRLTRLGWTQQEIAEALTRVWPEGAVTQQRVTQLLQENCSKQLSCKNEYANNVSVPTLSKRYDLPELLVWACALDGQTDQERLDALDITLQPYDALHFNGSDDRFGTSDYPGRIPGQLIAHVLHWFTKPGDTVLDPMAGGGTVSDVCLVMGRSCYAYDINTSPRIDILHHDLAVDGWPERLKKADLIFWDPPYFAKKDDGYPEGSISRLDRTQYLEFFQKAFASAKEKSKHGARMAFLMSDWNDHEGQQTGIFLWDYADLLRQTGWTLTEHLQVPLSTQQVHPDIVTKFRQSGRRARLERYLLIAKA